MINNGVLKSDGFNTAKISQMPDRLEAVGQTCALWRLPSFRLSRPPSRGYPEAPTMWIATANRLHSDDVENEVLNVLVREIMPHAALPTMGAHR